MGENVEFITQLHTSTKRDYVGRVTEFPKGECAKVARQWGKDYWDGPRQYGYGGYKYDGRWRPVAEKMARHYGLKAGDKILDIGCGKAFLLYEFTQVVPGIEVAGLDISEWGINDAKEEIRDKLTVGNCIDLPYDDHSFDFVWSFNTFHNLYNYELYAALQEMQRVGKDKKYVVVESYRNEDEKANLLYWQLTCESFCTPEEWLWWYKHTGLECDYAFIYFE
jgi:protein-L-isoaspartate(D-aspartate) O-methyltransferase